MTIGSKLKNMTIGKQPTSKQVTQTTKSKRMTHSQVTTHNSQVNE
jgi:hypothetical protein